MKKIKIILFSIIVGAITLLGIVTIQVLLGTNKYFFSIPLNGIVTILVVTYTYNSLVKIYFPSKVEESENDKESSLLIKEENGKTFHSVGELPEGDKIQIIKDEPGYVNEPVNNVSQEIKIDEQFHKINTTEPRIDDKSTELKFRISVKIILWLVLSFLLIISFGVIDTFLFDDKLWINKPDLFFYLFLPVIGVYFVVITLLIFNYRILIHSNDEYSTNKTYRLLKERYNILKKELEILKIRKEIRSIKEK